MICGERTKVIPFVERAAGCSIYRIFHNRQFPINIPAVFPNINSVSTDDTEFRRWGKESYHTPSRTHTSARQSPRLINVFSPTRISVCNLFISQTCCKTFLPWSLYSFFNISPIYFSFPFDTDNLPSIWFPQWTRRWRNNRNILKPVNKIKTVRVTT